MTNKLSHLNNKINQGFNNFFHFLFKKHFFMFYFIVITLTSFILRLVPLKIFSIDMSECLIPWCSTIKANGTKSFLHNYPLAYNYSMSYFYILTFVSKIGHTPTQYAYLLKAVSIFFDFVLAFFLGLICYNLKKSKTSFIIGYTLALILPTLYINGALWGQCDSIFTSFIVISLYLILKNKPNLAMLSYGLSLSFKLQAIFFLPVILLLVLKRKLNFTSLFMIIISFVGINLFSLFLGANLYIAFFKSYIVQLGSYGTVSVNFPNLYFLVNNYFASSKTLIDMSAILFTGFTLILCFIVIAFLAKKEFEVSNSFIVNITLVFAILVPYFLPRMHERYLYLADALLVIYSAINFKNLLKSFLIWFPSLRYYLIFIFQAPVSSELSKIILALMVLLSLSLILYDVYKQITKNNDSTIINKEIL